MMPFLRIIVRPLGYLMFVIALAALSGAAKLLGNRDDLGFFSEKLSAMLWRYPEVTRPGVQMAWIMWAVLFGIAISPLDPIPSSWDEVVLGAGAVIVLVYRFFAGQRAEH
jgi:hypothetical protein